MKKTNRKREYEVLENETIDQCLNRIKADGFVPVKRTEKPIFKEEIVNGLKKAIPVGRVIIFEAKQL
ncbi:NETI motif-containing protein [Bacillus songklensis]|uniref:NETI motif-containing protein n=1 Tax=Bacillus songklensis TaxID=1069116 RepID=A0ABV8B8C4_9BACI